MTGRIWPGTSAGTAFIRALTAPGPKRALSSSRQRVRFAAGVTGGFLRVGRGLG
ncbi:MAG TPA: hypothetical protein VF070_03315 [Streptosporangiaceae bacterium]